MIEEPVGVDNTAKLKGRSRDDEPASAKDGGGRIDGPHLGISGLRMTASSDENSQDSLTHLRQMKRSRAEENRYHRQNVDPKKSGVLYTIKTREKVYHQWENPLLDKKYANGDPTSAAVIEIFMEKSGRLGHGRFRMDTSDDENEIYDSDEDSGAIAKAKRIDSFRERILEGLDNLEGKSTKKNIDEIDSVDTSIRTSKMHIYSGQLKDILRNMVTYYPSQALMGDWIVIDYPYKVLMHHYHDLCQLEKDSLKAAVEAQGSQNGQITNGVTERSTEDAQTSPNHLTILNGILEPMYFDLVKPIEDRYQAGVASFANLWMLFKPGMDAYAKVGGKLEGFVISSTKQDTATMEIGDTNEQQWRRYWAVQAWKLTFVRGRVCRVYRTFKILKFKGEKEITSLSIFPSMYLDSMEVENNPDATSPRIGNVRKELEERGKAYYELLRALPVHSGYEGVAWDYKNVPNAWQRIPKLQYKGEIIIDPTAYLNNAPEMSRPLTVRSSRYNSGSDSERDVVPMQGNEENTKWVDYDNVDPKAHESLTPHHYFLFPRRIDGYALKSKKWMSFDVDGMKPLKWSAEGHMTLNQLILPRRDIEIIKALSSKQAKESDRLWGVDFIEGKGEGQVILLHGPPGTGKTYTVECVADYTRRPLVVLTVADIGTSEVRMEENLSRWFTLAASWRAIILMDEADVFLEKRQVADLQRNSLVSVFLRCMEYYPGMLFLTTNRIGQIDDAFLSRTSVAITYNPLTSMVQSQIWDGFLQKLQRERPDLIVTDRAKEFLATDQDMQSIPWNGREIRNALQIAIDLAICDAEQDSALTGKKASKIEVDKEHFLKVVLRRKSFIEYRNSIRNRTEEQRAQGEGSRALLPKN